MRHGMVKGQQNLSLALKVQKSLMNLLRKSLWVSLRSSKMLSSRWATTHMLASSFLVLVPEVGGDSRVVSLKSLKLIFKDYLKLCNYLHIQRL